MSNILNPYESHNQIYFILIGYIWYNSEYILTLITILLRSSMDTIELIKVCNQGMRYYGYLFVNIDRVGSCQNLISTHAELSQINTHLCGKKPESLIPVVC